MLLPTQVLLYNGNSSSLNYKDMMKNPSLYYILPQFFVLSQLLLHCSCQQEYLGNTVYDCKSFNFTVNAGYVCGGQEVACVSFLTFRSRPPYDTPQRISDLLNTDVSSIVSINNISSSINQNIPSNQTVIVPLSCLCSGNNYEHATRYTIKPNDTTCIYLVSNNFQGLTSCPMLQRQILYNPFNIDVGSQIIVPVLCACPTFKQISDGISHLLVHTFESGDTIDSVAEAYGVDQQSLLAANELSSNATVFALTPILVPLKPSACKLNPHLFYCTCSFYQRYNPESFNTPDCDYLRHSRRFPIKLVASIGVGTGAVFLCLFLLGYKLHQRLKEKQERVRKEKLFRQNGGLLLQEKMSSYGSREKAKHFTAEELGKATDNYNQSRFLGQGGFGTVYKGMLPDGTIVAVKRSKDILRNQVETFINEVVILSQINHRNIVKLLGCCLETEAPLLVYEFIPNGTLSHHIHHQELEANLSWDARLQIACEVAGAVAYMHSAASIPIFHRDIKTSNILLDHNYNAKVSDFGTSRSVPDDRTHLTTVVQGTFGYIDPEYFQSSQFTDKSDVYSFGVVLVELITGRKPITFSEENQGQNLVAEFISLMKEDQVLEIFDIRVVREGRKDDLLGIANLALRCLRLNGKKRPTMREVSAELESLKKTESSLKIIENCLEFPEDRKSAEQGTPSESDEEFKEESPSLFFQIYSISI